MREQREQGFSPVPLCGTFLSSPIKGNSRGKAVGFQAALGPLSPVHSFGEWIPKAEAEASSIPREGFPKGRGLSPSGGPGRVETPWCFSSGVWGGFFSRKECAPRPCSGNYPLREQREQDTSAGDPGLLRAEARFFPPVPPLCNKTPVMLQLYYKPPHPLEIHSSECYLSITKQAKL